MGDDWVRIQSSLYEHEDFMELSKDAKLLLFVLKTSLPRIGIGTIIPGTLEAKASMTPAEVTAAFDELAAGDHWWVKREGMTWWVRNGLKFEQINPNNSKNATGVLNRALRLPNKPIVAEFCLRYASMYPPLRDHPSITDISPINHRPIQEKRREEKRKEENQDVAGSPDRSQAAGPDGPPDFAGLVKRVPPPKDVPQAEVEARIAAQRRQLERRRRKEAEA